MRIHKHFFLFSFILLFLSLPFSVSASSSQICDSYNGLYEAMAEDVLNYKTEGVYYTDFEPKNISYDKIKEKVKEKDYIQGNCFYSIEWSYTHVSNKTYKISASYGLYMTESQRSTVENICNKIAKELKGKSDFEKIKYAHDYIILNCEYSFFQSGPYNCLKKGEANCSGYALAFQMMMDACGIKCEYVSNSAHAWNEVWLDGKSYNIDLTWDDNKLENVDYDYFLKCDADFPNHSGANATALISYDVGYLTADSLSSSSFLVSFLSRYRFFIVIVLVGIVFVVTEILKMSAKEKKEKQESQEEQ